MGVTTELSDGIAEVVMDNPPVNALTVAGWYDVARQITEAGQRKDVGAVILRAEGKGFNAGVDIKEMQNTEGFDVLVGVNRGCHAAFKAIYECEVPVVSAVNGYCLGGGIGFIGNSDVIVASDDATFAIPEIDRGALGVATHLSRLVPILKARAMYFTGSTATAHDLHAFGSVWKVVPRDELRSTAIEVAKQIAAKDTRVMRMAKEAFNGIDLWDVNRAYRYEQGFTFELNLLGVADEHRDRFMEKGARG